MACLAFSVSGVLQRQAQYVKICLWKGNLIKWGYLGVIVIVIVIVSVRRSVSPALYRDVLPPSSCYSLSRLHG